MFLSKFLKSLFVRDPHDQYIEQYMFIQGQIQFDHDLLIAGKLEGELVSLSSSNKIVVFSKGTLKTQHLNIHTIEIHGTCSFSTLKAHSVYIHSTAHVSGHITAENLYVFSGGEFSGTATIQKFKSTSKIKNSKT